jgi:hypothetical protein
MKRTRVNIAKTCGLFTWDWPEWISVETYFHLDLDWACLKESKFVTKLALLYPTVTFISWEIGVKLPPVKNFVFCSQRVMLIVGCTCKNGRPTKSVRQSAVRTKT